MKKEAKTKVLMYLLKAVNNILTNLGNLNDSLRRYITGMDGWVKDINNKIEKFSDAPGIVNENIDNIQHNYELIFELKDQMEELKQEVNALKLIQIILIKRNKVIQEKGLNK